MEKGFGITQDRCIMKVLILGGTGRLSMDVAKLATKMGHKVYLLTRGTEFRRLFVEKEYCMLYGDIKNIEDCKKLVNQYGFFDIVVDFLSFTPDHVKNKLNIISGCFKQYIFISSATVYHNFIPGEKITEENTPIGNRENSYAYNKFLCENYVIEYFKDKSEDYTIVRPYVTYGKTRVPYPIVPRNSIYEWTLIDRILSNKPILSYDNGETITTITHTRDFARGIVPLFGNRLSYGEAFHITTNQTVTWGKVIDIICEILCKKAIVVDMERKDIYSIFSEYESVIEGDKGRTMSFNTDKICKVIPNIHNNTVSLETGLAEMIDFYLSNPEYQLIDNSWNDRLDQLIQKY